MCYVRDDKGKTVGIELPECKVIKPLQEGESQLAIRGLENYLHGSIERSIQVAGGDKIYGLEAARIMK